MNEPAWLIGKHSWDGSNCRICHLQRRVRSFEEQDTFLYTDRSRVMHLFAPPCIPQIETPVEGLLTAKEAAEILGMTASQFTTNFKYKVECLAVPTAITTKNVYLWSAAHVYAALDEIKAKRA